MPTRLAARLRKAQAMSRLSRHIRTDDFIAEAKARAKAALKQKKPKLTALEKAFLEAFKKDL